MRCDSRDSTYINFVELYFNCGPLEECMSGTFLCYHSDNNDDNDNNNSSSNFNSNDNSNENNSRYNNSNNSINQE